MRRFLLIYSTLLLTFVTNHAVAQSTRWNNAPRTGFVFEITNAEAEKLLTKSRPDTIINALLHTPVDTFDVNKGWTRRPGKGHFILATIVGNKLHCTYTSVFPYQVLLLKEYNALALQVLDFDGNVRDDARVKFKTRRIRFDRTTKTYRIDNQWFNSLNKMATVELDGFRSVFNIEKHEVPTWASSYNPWDDGPDFYSYMITDKNKYRPREHVRFKSFALTGGRNPIRRDLALWLITPGRSLPLGTVSPHRPGSFAGDFLLHDSLRLKLDQHYSLQLRDKAGRIVATCGFKYEDYELHGNKLTVELATATQFYPAPNVVKMVATDANGLILKDARATITVMTDNVREIFQQHVTLPDTLLVKTINLDGDTATVIDIPSALFQKTNASYRVHVAVLNSEHQRMEQVVGAVHYFTQYELTASYTGDSIRYAVMSNGAAMPNVPATLYRDGATTGTPVILSHTEKINAATATVAIQSDVATRTIRMGDMLPALRFDGGIAKDSFNITLHNPQRVPVSWYIYQGSTLLESGSGVDMAFASAIADRSESYQAEVLYAFGGTEHVMAKTFKFRSGTLNIALNMPDRVYPGQTVDATIDVTDDEGHPAGGVDLTAFATNAKLNYYPPSLPYYGRTSWTRAEKATYTKHDLNKHHAILDLDFSTWAKRARLDTMRYYRLAYPGDKMFYHQTTVADKTQFAPYVMQQGSAVEVYVIEVDHVPVYYSWTDQPKAYSFYVTPERPVQVSLRLHDRVLLLDSMCFDAGKKTIFSFDLDHLPAQVKVLYMTKQRDITAYKRKRMKWAFTSMETTRYLRYLAHFNRTSTPNYLIDPTTFTPVSPGGPSKGALVVGPIRPGKQTYIELGRVETTYEHAGGFGYTFDDNIVYKTDAKNLMPGRLLKHRLDPAPTLNDVAITREVFLQRAPDVAEQWHPRTIDVIDYTCRLKIMLPEERAKTGVASVLLQDCATKKMVSACRDNTGSPNQLTIPRGCQNAFVLYNNGTYLKMEGIVVQSYATVAIDLQQEPLHEADSLSRRWLDGVTNSCFTSTPTPPRTYNFVVPRRVVGNLHGRIYDDGNMPLPGAAIVVKGTDIGTMADINGEFVLDITEDPSILVVSFIGYVTQEIETRAGSAISVVLQPDVTQLQEVVVVGYGSMQRHELTAASVSLRGMVAGVSISHETPDTDDDAATNSKEEQRQAEQQLYEELLTLTSIRSNFSDVGFWEPRLFTDRHGKAKFKVTFPDDVTRWDAVVYGMNRRLQTGTGRKSIRSYKPLMAQLYVPSFLTVGDSAHFVGKVLNYTADKSVTGNVTWKTRDSTTHNVNFDSYYTEQLPVVATSADTITTQYSFTRTDGYFDGEQRKVPVVQMGTVRASGSLTVLDNNDEIRIQPTSGSLTKVEIFDQPLDLYKGDAQYLINYRYACNEQLASKLIGLLNYRLIAQYEGTPFNYDKDVNKIIERLLKNQNEEFLWSWWDVSPNTSYWMSAHVLRALAAAKDAGYKVDLDVTNLVRKATYKYDYVGQVTLADVQILHALALWNAKVDYSRLVNMLERDIEHRDSLSRADEKQRKVTRRSLLNEKLMLLEVRQLQHLPFVRDSLLRYKQENILHEVYFTDGLPARNWYNGNLTTNAIAYRIVKRDSVLKTFDTAMQLYFLSHRRKGDWNTYEASNVLMSILPDLIAQGSTKARPATLAVAGKHNGRIDKLPYRNTVAGGETLVVKKESGMPLYCMQYDEERVTTAHAGTDAFKIATTFNTEQLKAGVPAMLEARVEIKRDAKLEHVMIEIPIPGGCDYADKRQGGGVETHREYFKERTVIFCENMAAGTYVFRVLLLPRFTGKYHVNPAQVSLMYFPVINANNNMSTVKINE